MTGAEFLAGLRKNIPLTIAMGIEVDEFGPRAVTLKIPFEPNRNHVDSVFGGSLYAACALGCYGLFRAISAESGIVSDNLVIQEGAIEYRAPVTGDFEVRAARPPEEDVRKFLDGLDRRGKARLRLRATAIRDGVECAAFEGFYVFRE